MTEKKWTPGPWYVVGASGDDVIISTMPTRLKYPNEEEQQKWQAAAVVSSSEWTHLSEADAYLIAAAPDLYAVLQEFDNFVTSSNVLSGYEYVRMRSRIKDALAKARGEAQPT